MGLVYGVGVTDVDYITQVWEEAGYVEGKRKRKLLWICPHRDVWAGMLERCYSEKLKQKHPTYRDAHCIEEWLRLSLFKGWSSKQGDIEGKQLDKDIIIPGNKLYSPETCAYVLPATNKFVTARDALRGEHLIGVSFHKRDQRFQAYCSNPFTKNLEHLGYFLTEQEAHEAWRKRKHELAQLVAETESDIRVVEALKKRYSVEEWYK